MRDGKRRIAVVTAIVVAATIVGGCAGNANDGGTPPRGSQPTIGHNDINPQPPDKIKNGGTVQWPVDELATNWNENELDGANTSGKPMVDAVVPALFRARPDGVIEPDPDYLTSARLRSTDPQVVEYKLNPKATWSNGRRFDWDDLRVQWQALNGRNTAYLAAKTTGYDSISSVERGADDEDVIVTFARDFGEWRGLFSPLYPKEINADPQEFNKGWANTPKITAGPFKVGAVDLTAKTATLVRDPKWWGATPHLDSIVFKVVARNALADALASGAIDFYRIGSSTDLFRRASTMPGVTVRQALEDSYNLLDFMGAPPSLLGDQATRVAVEQGVDTQAIAKALLGPMQPNPVPLGNHFFVHGNSDYRDNSAPVAFNPDAARRQLDSLGWKTSGQFRAKDGKPLQLAFVIDSGNPIAAGIATLVQGQLKDIGVDARINAVPSGDLIKNYVHTGAYDLIFYGMSMSPQPLSSARSSFYLGPNNSLENTSHIGNEATNRLLDQAGAELDDAKRVDLLQQADVEIWKTGHILPLYQVPGAYAVRATLANFGAFGFAQFPIDYSDIGFMK